MLLKTRNTCFSKYSILYIIALTFIRPAGATSADQFFMAAHGADMVQNGLTRSIDIFTVHGLDFMYQKWAMCIVSHWIYKYFGDMGFVVGAYILFFIFLLTLWYVLEKLNPNRNEFNVPIVFAVAFALNSFTAFRPQMLEAVLLMLLLILMEDFIKGAKKIHYLYFLLISVAAMWIHSTMWVMMPIFMLPYLCDFAFLQKLWKCQDAYSNKKDILKALGVVLFGSLLQPNGISQYKYLYICLTATSDTYKQIIDELNPSYFSSPNITIYLMIIIGLFFAIKYGYRLRAVYMLCGGLLMSLVAYRMCFYSMIIIAFGLALNYQLCDIKVTEKASKALSCLCLISVILLSTLTLTCAQTHYSERMAFAGKDAIDNLPQDSTVFCSTMDAGSYAIAKGHKVYIDCRAEIYDIELNHKKDLLTEYRDLIIGKYKDNSSDTYMEDFNNDYGFDYYVVNEEGIKINQSLSKCAELVYEDEHNKVYKFN